MENIEDGLLRVAFQIDEQIPAGDEIEMGKGRIFQHIMRRKKDAPADFFFDPVTPLVAKEKPAQSFLRDIGGSIGPFFVLWVVVMTAGASNAVNLTDGLDGLATGAAGLVLASYVLIGIWQERNDCTNFLAPQCYSVRDPLDMAVVAAAVLPV